MLCYRNTVYTTLLQNPIGSIIALAVLDYIMTPFDPSTSSKRYAFTTSQDIRFARALEILDELEATAR